jgi:hypothetical protein
MTSLLASLFDIFDKKRDFHATSIRRPFSVMYPNIFATYIKKGDESVAFLYFVYTD